jgi:peptide deformylase
MLAIRRFDDRVLLMKALPVEESEFGETMVEILSSMAETMYGSKGVGLAGPQVGFIKRVLVIDTGYVKDNKYGGEWLGMINPEILDASKESSIVSEGCLSFPSLLQKVDRPERIRVKFFSPMGEGQEREFEGFQARIIQHEIDHLNGVTLLGRAGTAKRRSYMKKINKVRKSMDKLRK